MKGRMMQKSHTYNGCGPVVKQFLIYTETIKGRSNNTVNSYYQDLKLFFRFLKQSYKLVDSGIEFSKINTDNVDLELIKKVTLNDIYEFLYFVSSQRSNCSKTRARKVSTIKSFFKYLTHNQKLLSENPSENLDSPKLKSTLPRYLNLEQSKQLLYNVDGSFALRDYCIIALFLNCGLRLSELVSLNLSDVAENPMVVTGKGNKERFIYLNEACKKAISDYIGARKPQKTTETAFFLAQNGKRISKRRVQEIVTHNLKKNNLDKYSTHKLRHTAATLMFQYGKVDVRTLQEILGHKNLSTTQIYTHISNDQLKEAAVANPLSSFQKKFKNEQE